MEKDHVKKKAKIQVRCTEVEKTQLAKYANERTNGNMSAYILYASLRMPDSVRIGRKKKNVASTG